MPGRRMATVGAVMATLAVVAAVLVSVVLLRRVDLNDMRREVDVLGPGKANIPGQVAFRIVRPLASDDPRMTVGVGATTASSAVTCTLAREDGTPVDTRRGSDQDQFLNQVHTGLSIVVVGEDLRPGSYVARCEQSGEPPSTRPTFTVGRVLTLSEAISLLSPVLWVVGVVALCALVMVIGLILLVVGLVRARKHRRQGQAPPTAPPAPPAPPGPPTPPPYRGYPPGPPGH